MTQLQTMSDQELNRKLADLMGYTLSNVQVNDTIIRTEIDGEYHLHSFDPCTDPAASLEVQTKAIEVNKLAYLNSLLSKVSPEEDIQYGPDGIMEVVGYTIDGTAAMFTCTHRQRAEAAYMTLQAGK